MGSNLEFANGAGPHFLVDDQEPNHWSQARTIGYSCKRGLQSIQQVIQRLPPHSAQPYFGVDCGKASSIS